MRCGIGAARRGVEREVVHHVAAERRQLEAVACFGRRRAGLGELPGDAADLHRRHAAASPTSLAAVADGRAFVLQAGDCAESFDAFSANAIRDKLKVILQMAVVLTYGSGVPDGEGRPHRRPVRQAPLLAHRDARRRRAAVVPRRHGQRLRVRRRRPAAPIPSGSSRAYHQSASTLNLLRAFTKGGFADLSRVHAWNLEFVDASPEGRRYDALAAEIDRALRFMAACGIDLDAEHQLHQVDFYTSHEALLLGYEEALTRQRQPHRRLVRLLGPPAVDRRAHPPARRRARRVPAPASATRSA